MRNRFRFIAPALALALLSAAKPAQTAKRLTEVPGASFDPQLTATFQALLAGAKTSPSAKARREYGSLKCQRDVYTVALDPAADINDQSDGLLAYLRSQLHSVSIHEAKNQQWGETVFKDVLTGNAFEQKSTGKRFQILGPALPPYLGEGINVLSKLAKAAGPNKLVVLVQADRCEP